MKTIFRLLCGWMAIALTTACSHEELLQTEPVQKPAEGKMVSVKAYTPSEQPASRLAFDDQGTEGLKLSWSEGDAFTAVVGNSKVTFTYDANTKEFSGTLPDGATLTDGVKAYYPAYYGENFEKDFSRQTGALNSATTYMEGAYDATAQAFRFNHSTAILKVAFSGLPQNAEIESISIDINNASIIAINDVTGVDMNSVYFNLPALAKDSKLVFYVETTAGLYTSTQTVTVDAGIEVGKFYVASIVLAKATVCNLPTGSTFCGVIGNVIGDAISIVFEANSTETGGTQIGSSTAYAKVVGTTLKIYTAAAEFVFNENCSSMFYSLEKIQTIDFGNHINTDNVTHMNSMFSYSPSLTSLDLSSFNTEKVKDMNSMFEGCLALESLDLSSFNTANVTDMGSMFDGCSALESLDLRSFNTAKVTDMGFMFQDCQKLTLLDLTNFDFSKVQNFESMFYELGREAENQPIPVYVTAAGYNILLKDEKTDINQWYAEYAVPGHLPAGSTFKAAVNSFLESNSSLTKIKFIANSNNTNKDNRIGTSEPYMVAGSDNTLEIHTAEAEFVFNKDCSRMFSYLTNIQSIDFGNCVNTANVIDMFFMFQDCSSLTSLDLSSFNTSNVTKMYNMFDGCTKLTSLDLSNFNTTSVTNMCNMFYSCNKLASLNLLSFDFSKVQYFDYMFYELGKEVENQPIPVYVTAAGYDILSQEDTYYAYYYAQYVDEDGDPY